jgi:hypothetical protein
MSDNLNLVPQVEETEQQVSPEALVELEAAVNQR